MPTYKLSVTLKSGRTGYYTATAKSQLEAKDMAVDDIPDLLSIDGCKDVKPGRPVSPKPLLVRSIRLNDEQWAAYVRRGGDGWLRKLLD